MDRKAIAEKVITDFINRYGTDRECWRETYCGVPKGKPIALHTAIMFSKYCLTGGMDRLCLVPKKGNFIIKVDRYPSTDNKFTSNEIEYDNYKLAKIEGLEHYFAKPLEIITMFGLKWYLFERVPFIGQPDKFSKQTFENSKLLDYLYEECGEWEDAFNYISTSPKAYKLVDFCIRNAISDIHEGNFGWSNRLKHIVITDYAGF